MRVTDDQLEALARAFKLERSYAEGKIDGTAYEQTATPIYDALGPEFMAGIDAGVRQAGLTAQFLGELADDPVALRAWTEQL